jgi:hypothetical protein
MLASVIGSIGSLKRAIKQKAPAAAANASSSDLAKRRIVTLRIERRADHLSKDGCKVEGASREIRSWLCNRRFKKFDEAP